MCLLPLMPRQNQKQGKSNKLDEQVHCTCTGILLPRWVCYKQFLNDPWGIFLIKGTPEQLPSFPQSHRANLSLQGLIILLHLIDMLLDSIKCSQCWLPNQIWLSFSFLFFFFPFPDLPQRVKKPALTITWFDSRVMKPSAFVEEPIRGFRQVVFEVVLELSN